VTLPVRFLIAACCLGGALALTACETRTISPPVPPAQPPPEEAEPPPDPEVKVALLLPLSGPAEELGRDMLHAAQMALFDVGENELILLPRDTAGTPDGARDAVAQAINQEADLILGPLFSQAVGAITPLAQQAGIRVLAFSNVASMAADGTYLLGFRPEEQVDRVVRFALGAGLERIAGLAPDDAYGATALDALRGGVVEAGGQLGATLFYPPDLADPSAVVREVAAYDERTAALEEEKQRLEQELEQTDDQAIRRELERLETLDTFGEPPFDAILIADGGDRLRSVASLLTFYDVAPEEVRFLGTMRWQDDPRVLEEPALQGGWFAGPPPATLAAFERRFEAAFGSPPQQLAALAYDATALAVIVARDLGDPTFDPQTLMNPQGFAGATGLFRLRPDGLAEHGLAILEVRDGTARLVDPPPESFVEELAEAG